MMTVAELIELLKQMPQDAAVVFHDVWNNDDVELNNVQVDDGRVELTIIVTGKQIGRAHV